MVLSQKVIDILNSDGRVNVFATCSRQGEPNIAVFGSTALFSRDGELIVAMGENRSYGNLKENPSAACLVKLNNSEGLKMEGCKLYLRVKEFHDRGGIFDDFMGKIRARIGKAADMLRHVVVFEITKTRPIVDMGQEI